MSHGWTAIAAATAVLALSTPLRPTLAQNVISPFQIQEIRRSVPDCRRNPQLAWRGDVSGRAEFPNGGFGVVAFSGCFDTESACTRWVNRTTSAFSGPIYALHCRRR